LIPTRFPTPRSTRSALLRRLRTSRCSSSARGRVDPPFFLSVLIPNRHLPEFTKQGNQDVDEEKPGNTGHRGHGDESVGCCGPAPAAIAAVIGEQQFSAVSPSEPSTELSFAVNHACAWRRGPSLTQIASHPPSDQVTPWGQERSFAEPVSRRFERRVTLPCIIHRRTGYTRGQQSWNDT